MATEYVEAGLKAKLATATTTIVAGRVYPNTVPPDKPYPYVTYFLKEGERHGRALTDAGSLVRCVFQVDGFAQGSQGYQSAKDIARLIGLDAADGGLNGDTGLWTYGSAGASFRVQDCKVENNNDDLAPESLSEDASGKVTHAVSLNVAIIAETPEGN